MGSNASSGGHNHRSHFRKRTVTAFGTKKTPKTYSMKLNQIILSVVIVLSVHGVATT